MPTLGIAVLWKSDAIFVFFASKEASVLLSANEQFDTTNKQTMRDRRTSFRHQVLENSHATTPRPNAVVQLQREPKTSLFQVVCEFPLF